MERIAIGIILAASAATGQDVTIAVTAPAPLAAGVVYGTVPYTSSAPAGPQSWQGHVTAASPTVMGSTQGASAHMHWMMHLPHVLLAPEARITMGFQGGVWSNAGPAIASIGPNELRFDIGVATPRDAFLEIDLTASLVGATQWPTWEVDVGDDGIVDAHIGNGAATIPVQIGANPLPVVVRCAATVGAPNPTWQTHANMLGNLEMKLTADNHVSIDEVVAGCGVGTLECRQAFAHDGVILRDIGGTSIKVLVLGTQPAPLPFSTGVSTCLLWPSADIVLGPITTLDLPIPPAVRPFMFYAQSLYYWNFFGPQVSASQALRIWAH